MLPPIHDTLVRLHTWAGVTLAVPADDNPLGGGLLLVFGGPHEQFWPADLILRNHFHRTRATTYRLAKGRHTRFKGAAHSSDLAIWASQTQALARDVEILHGPLAALAMLDAVKTVQTARLWTTRIVRPPRDPRRLLELRWAAEVFVVDEVRQAFQKYVPAPARDKWIAEMLQPVSDAVDSLGYPNVDHPSAAKEAITRLRARIVAGQHDHLVADILGDARLGPHTQK
jgi:hypothetical protein